MKNYRKLLCDPFELSDVKWRVQRSGVTNNKPWVAVHAYITGRAVQERLDDVFGIDGWEDVYKKTDGWTGDPNKPAVGQGYLCGIRCKFDDKWITKWDGAEFTSIEPLKGAISGALKRTAAKLGVGRYLYRLETKFAICQFISDRRSKSENGEYVKIKSKRGREYDYFDAEWFKPELPSWALPSVRVEELTRAIETAPDLIVLKSAFERGYNYAKSFNREDVFAKITAAKDARKATLIEIDQKEIAGDLMKLQVWLENQVTTHILTADNPSTLTLSKDKILEALTQKANDYGLDKSELVKTLKSYFQEQMRKMQ